MRARRRALDALHHEERAAAGREPPATVGSLHLEPGAHAITVRATARGRADEVVVVGREQPFWVTRGASSIGIRVRASNRESDGPVMVDVTMLGGRTERALSPDAVDAARARPHDDRCGSMMPIATALCRTAATLEDAARQNDIVAGLCLHDKLDEMRRLALIGGSGDVESAKLAETRVAAVSRLAERCGGTLSPLEPDGVTVTRSDQP